jgi:hypothetical protein
LAQSAHGRGLEGPSGPLAADASRQSRTHTQPGRKRILSVLAICLLGGSLLLACKADAPANSTDLTELAVITVGLPPPAVAPTTVLFINSIDPVVTDSMQPGQAATPRPASSSSLSHNSVREAVISGAQDAANLPRVTPTPEPKLTVTRLSSPTRRGAGAYVTVISTPNAICHGIYTPPPGPNNASLVLEAKTADASGSVAWIWTIYQGTTAGQGQVKVVCGPLTATVAIVVV